MSRNAPPHQSIICSSKATTPLMMPSATLTVFSSVDPLTLISPHNGDGDIEGSSGLLISNEDHALDALDLYNHTRQRRALILKELLTRKQQQQQQHSEGSGVIIKFDHPATASEAMFHQVYRGVHSEGLLTFLTTAWNQWIALGEEGQDPLGYLNSDSDIIADVSGSVIQKPPIPRPFVPSNMPLRRAGLTDQRPSQHVLGQVGYYGTDTCTPLFAQLAQELLQDTSLVHAAVERALQDAAATVSYIVLTHPGHHALTTVLGEPVTSITLRVWHKTSCPCRHQRLVLRRLVLPLPLTRVILGWRSWT